MTRKRKVRTLSSERSEEGTEPIGRVVKIIPPLPVLMDMASEKLPGLRAFRQLGIGRDGRYGMTVTLRYPQAELGVSPARETITVNSGPASEADAIYSDALVSALVNAGHEDAVNTAAKEALRG